MEAEKFKKPFSFFDRIKLFFSRKSFEELLESNASEAVNKFYATHKERFPEGTEITQAGLDTFYNLTSEEGLNTGLMIHLTSKLSSQKGGDVVFSKNYQPVSDLLMSSLTTVPITDLTDAELSLIQEACWSKYAGDPVIKGVVENYVDYVIGTGINVSTPVDEVTRELNTFVQNNKFFIKSREIVKSSFISGESFVLLFHNNEGYVFVRNAQPSTITGIEVCPDDTEVVFSYEQTYDILNPDGISVKTKSRNIKDIDYDFWINTKLYKDQSRAHKEIMNRKVVCKHIKLNDTDKRRGLPPLMSILKYAKYLENFIIDRMTLNHERAKVVWIKKVLGRAYETMKRITSSPRGGTMLVESDGVKYDTVKPNLDSSDAKEDALNLLYYIGSGIRFPLHILNQRTDQQVYASIRKADTPFARMIDSAQMFYGYNFEQLYRYQIKLAVEKGRLKKEYEFPAYSDDAMIASINKLAEGIVRGDKIETLINEVKNDLAEEETKMIKVKTEDIPITQDFPQILLQDPKEMAEVLKTHKEIGIASLATLSGKAGYNWKRELIRIVAEKKLAQDNDNNSEDLDKSETNKEKPRK